MSVRLTQGTPNVPDPKIAYGASWTSSNCGVNDPLGSNRVIPCHPPNGRNQRISPIAAHSGDRLLSEPTAGTQPCRREPLFMPLSGPFNAGVKGLLNRCKAVVLRSEGGPLGCAIE
jgi:hypothetical protein